MSSALVRDEQLEFQRELFENLHRNWKKDRDYLAPPATGKLSDLDPALIVTPPPGLEAGYFPIVTRQAAKE